MKEAKYILITHYSFDEDTPVLLFDALEDAQVEMKRQFEEERRIDEEENGWIVETKIDPDGMWASLTDIWYDGRDPDITTWSIHYATFCK